MEKEMRLIDANAYPCQNCEVSYCYKNCEKFNAWLKGTVVAAPVVRGRWREKILVGGFAEEWGFVCSECGCTVSDRSNLGIGRYASNNQRLNYCPNCGAKMDGDGNA